MDIRREHRGLLHVLVVLGALLIVLALLAVPVKAQSESWQTLLKAQLVAEQHCELTLVINFRRIPLGKLDGYEGRIRCRDGREFDFTQSSPNQKFTIKLCQPVVC